MRWFLIFCFILSLQFKVVGEEFSPQTWGEMKRFFEQHGYIWIKNFYSPQQMHLLEDWVEWMHQDAQKVLSLMEDKEQEMPHALIVAAEASNPLQVCRTEDMSTFYSSYSHFIEGTLTPYIGRLLQEPYVLFKEKLNFKWPGGGAFLPHQDFPAFRFLGPKEHVTAMIAIDPANLENGCLQVAENWKEAFQGDVTIDPEQLLAGRAILPYVEGGAAHGSIQSEYTDQLSWVALHVEPGDLVLFNSYIPHFSKKNTTNGPRRALFLTFNRLKEGNFRSTYYFAKRNDPQNPMFHFGTPTKARTK